MKEKDHLNTQKVFDFVTKSVKDYKDNVITFEELIKMRFYFNLEKTEKVIGIAGIIEDKPVILVGDSDKFEKGFSDYLEAFYPNLKV